MTARIEDFANDRFAAENGICYLEVGEGFARTAVTVESRHLNSLGIVHGGTLFTLAATALFAAANSRGKTAVGTNLNLSCLHAVSAGRLEARATEVARSRRISSCSVEVVDERGRLVATLQGTAYLKDTPFPPRQTA